MKILEILKYTRYLSIVPLGLLLSLAASHVEARPSGPWQIHGFISQAVITTSDNNFFGETDDRGSPEFGEIGLNTSARLGKRLQFAAQALSRRAGESDKGDLRLDYALLDYNTHSSYHWQGYLHVGRIKIPLGLYNDTRDVPMTRPSIFLAQSIYFDRTRDLAVSADGVRVLERFDRNQHQFSFEALAVQPNINNSNTEVSLFRSNQPGELEGRAFVERLHWDYLGGRYTAAISAIQMWLDYTPGTGDVLEEGGVTFNPVYLSLQSSSAQWILTGEVARRPIKFSRFGAALPNLRQTGQSAYVEAIYMHHHNLKSLVRYDVYYAQSSDKGGAKYAAQTGNPAFTRYAKDLAVGVNINFTQSTALRLELHRINGTGWLPLQDNPDENKLHQHWLLFSTQLSVYF